MSKLEIYDINLKLRYQLKEKALNMQEKAFWLYFPIFLLLLLKVLKQKNPHTYPSLISKEINKSNIFADLFNP